MPQSNSTIQALLDSVKSPEYSRMGGFTKSGERIGGKEGVGGGEGGREQRKGGGVEGKGGGIDWKSVRKRNAAKERERRKRMREHKSECVPETTRQVRIFVYI